MADRRPLVEGLKKAEVPRTLEDEFVFGEKKPTAGEGATPVVSPPKASTAISRVPLTTRLRADFAAALKRASLERQLNGVEPNTVQDILEEALEPWLKANGYLGR